MIGHVRSSAAVSRASSSRSGVGRHQWGHLLLALIPVVLLGQPGAAAGESPWSPPALPAPTDENADGRTIVQRAVDFVSGHQELVFEAQVTYEAIQEDGQKLQFDMLQRVLIRQPDQLFWMTLFDDASVHSAWCNRGEFTLLKQPANVWGRVNVPPTMAAAVSRISIEYNIDVPFVDILSGDVAELWLGEDVESVDFVGEAWIGGWWTDHIAIRKPGVDIELWLRHGDEPFPMKFALVYTGEPQLPGYSARFMSWSTKVSDDDVPKFEPPAGSEQLEVVPVIGN